MSTARPILPHHKYVQQALQKRDITPDIDLSECLGRMPPKVHARISQLVEAIKTTDAPIELWQSLKKILTASHATGEGEDKVGCDRAEAAMAKQEPSERPKTVIYGVKGALTVEFDKTRASKTTVSIDAAAAVRPRVYDWDKKITVQMTLRELPLLAALLMGMIDKIEFANHGAASDKSIKFEKQAGRVFCTIRQREHLVAVPITAPDVYAFAELVLAAMHENCPTVDGVQRLAMLKVSAKIHDESLQK